jgi:hypothetical protein
MMMRINLNLSSAQVTAKKVISRLFYKEKKAEGHFLMVKR